MRSVTFDFAELSGRERYKLLSNTVVPRPIAFVVTQSAAGRRNAAPFSFFNVFSEDPPIVVLGIGARGRTPGHPKDTARNIEETGEFTVNLVNEALVPGMSVCAMEFPTEVDELAESGLDTVESVNVKPPRVAAAPVQLECRRTLSLNLGGAGRTLVVGEVLVMHVSEDLVDPTNLRVDRTKLGLVGRVGSGGWYVRMNDVIQVKEPTLEEWQARRSHT